MNCLECRRLLLIEPRTRSKQLAAHLSECDACARLAQRQSRFEQTLDAALRVPVPENLRERVRFAASMRQPRRRHWHWRQIAAAVAAVVLVLALGLGGWEYRAGQRLADAMASQIQAVPAATSATPDGARITTPRLAKAAARLGDFLASAGLGRIVSARESTIDGQQAAQFVIAHGRERARVFMLPDARLALEHSVEAGGMPGRLIPTADGVIAVFCPDRHMLTRVAADMRDSMAQSG